MSYQLLYFQSISQTFRFYGFDFLGISLGTRLLIVWDLANLCSNLSDVEINLIWLLRWFKKNLFRKWQTLQNVKKTDLWKLNEERPISIENVKWTPTTLIMVQYFRKLITRHFIIYLTVQSALISKQRRLLFCKSCTISAL